MEPIVARYRQLDAEKIIETVRALHGRIEERFPGSGLGKIVAELLRVAEETVARARWIRKPHLPLRCAAGFLSLAIIVLVAGMLISIRQYQFNDYTNFIQALDASISSVVFIGAAIIFFVSWEHRIKRNRALKAIHELRAMAHIIDMHHLTKDPESCFAREPQPASTRKQIMTPLELNWYLDYCGESLALISKIAALYVQGFQDHILLDAVDDVEDLTSHFSQKIWQKISILENLGRSFSSRAAVGNAGGAAAADKTQAR
jgi:hypothetical protein